MVVFLGKEENLAPLEKVSGLWPRVELMGRGREDVVPWARRWWPPPHPAGA